MIRAICALLIAAGAATPSYGGLIGSTVDLKTHFPDLGTTHGDMGSVTVDPSTEFVAITDYVGFLADVSDLKISIVFEGSTATAFGSAQFNGFEFAFSGVTITGASVDASSDFSPRQVSIQGNSIFLDYAGISVPAHSFSVINVTSSETPEPGTLALLAAPVAALICRSRRSTRSAQ